MLIYIYVLMRNCVGNNRNCWCCTATLNRIAESINICSFKDHIETWFHILIFIYFPGVVYAVTCFFIPVLHVCSEVLADMLYVQHNALTFCRGIFSFFWMDFSFVVRFAHCCLFCGNLTVFCLEEQMFSSQEHNMLRNKVDEG